MKKALVGVMILALSISQIACSNAAKEVGEHNGVVLPKPKDGDATLTILLNPADSGNIMTNQVLKDYIQRFEKDFGVDVKLESIGTNVGKFVTQEDRSDFIQELSAKLYAKDGPELIYSGMLPIEPLMRQKAVVGLRDKVSNLNKVYNSLLDSDASFVPISMNYFPVLINLDALKTTGVNESEIGWTSKNRFDIRSKWLAANKIHFNTYEYEVTFDLMFDLDKHFDQDKNAFTLNTSELRQSINDIRKYIFHGNYILNNEYKFENYYNMMFEKDSPEFQKSFNLFFANSRSGYIDTGHITNLLNAEAVNSNNRLNNTIMMPQFSDREAIVNVCGFAVNKNGKNLELAYEFINGLLSDDMQMRIYKEDKQKFYPVNKDIEDDIKEIESKSVGDQRVLEVKEYALNQIKSGKTLIYNTSDSHKSEVKDMIYKELSKIILADQDYPDSELSAMLKKIEDKCNMFLNE